MESKCGALFKELQNIWAEIGETEDDKNHMVLEIERDCLQVYQKKFDEACNTRAKLHHIIAAKEAELANVMASLGEHTRYSQNERKSMSLKEQLAAIMPLLEDLKAEKEERVKQFVDVRSQIEKISTEIAGCIQQFEKVHQEEEEKDLSLWKLNEYQAQLRGLEKEKSDRVCKVLEHASKVHSLCSVLGEDFAKTLGEVHPSLPETGLQRSTNISNNTLNGLVQTIQKLTTEKRLRVQKLKQIAEALIALWNLMNSSEEEVQPFGRLISLFSSQENDVYQDNALTLETIWKAEAEVERLTKLKAIRVKELVFRKRAELEEICRRVHIEPDISTSTEKSNELIDSDLIDPSELLLKIEEQITKAREESIYRKEILDKISKWHAACEEEKWLEAYNQDENRYAATRGAHLNLKRAEKARLTVSKLPAMVENLINRTFAWEDERNMPFLYNGVRLVSILKDYMLARQKREEEKRLYREQKKLQNLLLKENPTLYAPRPIPKRISSFNRKANGYQNSSLNGFMTPTPRRISVGSATPELLSPRSYSGRQNNYFKETRFSNRSLNYSSKSKEDSLYSLASIGGSEPQSPLPF